MKAILLLLSTLAVISGCSTEPEPTIADKAAGIWIVYTKIDKELTVQETNNFRFVGNTMYYTGLEYVVRYYEDFNRVGMYRAAAKDTTEYEIIFAPDYKSFTGGGTIKKKVQGRPETFFVSLRGER